MLRSNLGIAGRYFLISLLLTSSSKVLAHENLMNGPRLPAFPDFQGQGSDLLPTLLNADVFLPYEADSPSAHNVEALVNQLIQKNSVDALSSLHDKKYKIRAPLISSFHQGSFASGINTHSKSGFKVRFFEGFGYFYGYKVDAADKKANVANVGDIEDFVGDDPKTLRLAHDQSGLKKEAAWEKQGIDLEIVETGIKASPSGSQKAPDVRLSIFNPPTTMSNKNGLGNAAPADAQKTLKYPSFSLLSASAARPLIASKNALGSGEEKQNVSPIKILRHGTPKPLAKTPKTNFKEDGILQHAAFSQLPDNKVVFENKAQPHSSIPVPPPAIAPGLVKLNIKAPLSLGDFIKNALQGPLKKSLTKSNHSDKTVNGFVLLGIGEITGPLAAKLARQREEEYKYSKVTSGAINPAAPKAAPAVWRPKSSPLNPPAKVVFSKLTAAPIDLMAAIRAASIGSLKRTDAQVKSDAHGQVGDPKNALGSLINALKKGLPALKKVEKPLEQAVKPKTLEELKEDLKVLEVAKNPQNMMQIRALKLNIGELEQALENFKRTAVVNTAVQKHSINKTELTEEAKKDQNELMQKIRLTRVDTASDMQKTLASAKRDKASHIAIIEAEREEKDKTNLAEALKDAQAEKKVIQKAVSRTGSLLPPVLPASPTLHVQVQHQTLLENIRNPNNGVMLKKISQQTDFVVKTYSNFKLLFVNEAQAGHFESDMEAKFAEAEREFKDDEFFEPDDWNPKAWKEMYVFNVYDSESQNRCRRINNETEERRVAEKEEINRQQRVTPVLSGTAKILKEKSVKDNVVPITPPLLPPAMALRPLVGVNTMDDTLLTNIRAGIRLKTREQQNPLAHKKEEQGLEELQTTIARALQGRRKAFEDNDNSEE